MAAPQASSRLEMLQARFQQKQLQEKEQKLLQLYDQQQQRAYQVAQRASAGSNASNHGSSGQHTLTRTTSNIHTPSNSQGGKVRQMFDERRQTTVKGIDRSYPLEPLDNKLRKQTSNGVVPSKNNVSRQTVSVKRVARADVNSNINAGKPIVSYHEEITRDTFGPQGHKQEIFEHDYDGENHVTRLSNGNLRDGSQFEFDETLKNRVRNDLESEQFPEDLMIDVPDKLPKKTGAARKLTQAETRLERFKNSAAKNPGLKSTGNALGVAKKRTETTGTAKSNTSEFKRSTSPFSTKWRTDVFLPMRSSKTLGVRETSPREYGNKLGGAAAIQARDTSVRGYGSRDFGSPSPKFFSETSRISSRTSSLDRKSLRSQSPEYAKLREIRRQIRDVGTRSPSSGSRSPHEAFGGTSPLRRSPRSRSLEHTRTYQTRDARGTGGSRNTFVKSPSSTEQFTGDGSSGSRITRISSLDRDSGRSASSAYTRLSKIRDIKIRNSGSKDAFATTRSRSSSPGRSTATFSLAGKSPRSRSLDRLRSGINSKKGTRSDDENSRQTDFGKQIAINRQVRPGLSDLSKKTTASFQRKIRGVGLRQSDNSLNKPVGSRVKRSPRPVTLESDIRVNKGLSPRINKDVEIFQPYALKRRGTSPRLRENYSTSYNLNGRFDGPLRTLENDIFVNEGLEPTWDKDVEVFDPYLLRRQSTSPQLTSKYSVDSGIASGPNQGLGRPRTLETDILVNKGLGPTRHRDVEVFGTHTQKKRSASPQLISKSRSRSWSPHFFQRECTKTGAASKLDDRSNRLVRDIIRKHRSKDSQLITPTESPVLHRRSSDLTVKSPSSRSGSLTALKDIPSEEIDRRYSSSVERSLRRSKSPILQKRDPYSEERIEFKSGKRSVSPSYHRSRILGSSPRSFTSEVDTEIQEITMTDQFIDPRKYHGGRRSTVTLKTVPSQTYSTKGKRKVAETSEGDRSFLRPATKTGQNKSFSLGLNIYSPLDTFGKRPISQLSTSSSNDDYKLRSKSLERDDCFKAGTDKSSRSRSRSSSSRSVSSERYKAAPFALHGKDEAFGSRYEEEPNKGILNSLIEDSNKNMRELQQTLARKRREVSLLARKPKANIPFKSVLKKTPINNRLMRGTAMKCRLGATSANDPSKLTRLIRSSPNCRRKLFSDADSNAAAEDRKSKRCTTCKERSGGGGGDQPAKTQAKHCSRREPRSHSLDFALLGKGRGRGRGKSADSSRPGHLAINLNSRRRARSIDSRKTDDGRSIDPSASVKQLRSIENIRKSMSSPKLSVGRRISGKTAIANQIHGDFKSRRDDKQQRMMDSVLQTKKILSKIKSPGYRVTKSPSPDIALKKTESNPRASIRRSVPTSPSKSPDIIPRRATTDIRSQEARSTRRSGPGSSGDASTSKVSLGSVKGTDEVDAIMFRNDSSNSGFSENFDDQLKSKEKATIKKQTSEKQISSTTGRPPSSISSISSASSMPGQTSGAKKGMASKAKLKAPPISSGRVASASMENLVPCKCCSRRFAPDRIKKHEEICAGTSQKKRKQFDSMKFRVRGTELEPFVKKVPHKKQPEKAKKLEVKSDWRRKHEDFINAIRSAKQVKAHLDAGGKLSDLPPPPPSDTSDYIQCPHCGRKFNQAAAERHIPKCVHMLHNKPAHSRAPQRLKR